MIFDEDFPLYFDEFIIQGIARLITGTRYHAIIAIGVTSVILTGFYVARRSLRRLRRSV